MCPRTDRTAPVPWHWWHGPVLRRVRPLPAHDRQFSRRVTGIARWTPTSASSNVTCISTCREVEALEPRRTPLLCRRVMSGVVPRSPRRIDQRFVRFENLPESLFGGLIARIDVRVKPARKTTVRPLDLGLRRPLRHA
jgi:hypothetical protein